MPRRRPPALVAAITSIAVALVVVAGCGGGGNHGIARAPAFDARALGTPRYDGWLTNGGSLYNDRFAPLAEIDASNVKRLKGVWRTHLRNSATAAKYSGEAQPLIYKGTIYIVTGADDVFAADAKSGKILWEHQGNLDKRIDTVCCGWTSRGVALGDGKVYVGRIDGKLEALDQKTGKREWVTSVGDWRKGYTITAAPLYYDGRIYTGLSGGEYGIRGRLTAFDAKTGKELWRFHTIPGPGETGHNTWPAGNDAWKHGGAPVWQTPAVDPELGLLYFSTGNAAPDLSGHDRAGNNLFSSSIVAIDAKTGKYRWHFQQVHHDIWDYDAPSPVVLFDQGSAHGVIHGLAEAGKTGWLYMLDRRTGKPLYGVDERPVPQNAYQRTARTQPFPRNPPFVDHRPTTKAFQGVQGAAKASADKGKAPKIERAKEIFEPFGQTIKAITPGPPGGTNWPASSFSRSTGYVYVCGESSTAGYSLTEKQSYRQGKQYLGSVLTLTGFGNQPGTFTAIDVTSGRIVWQKKWAESCYSGSLATAGNLVFVGRNSGELQAYDARSGALKWSFQTGAGANSTASAFERGGHEYIAFYSAGNSLAASRRGDSLWLFGLDGRLGPVKAGGAGPAGTHAGEAQPQKKSPSQGSQQTDLGGDPAMGQSIFSENCSICHGADGHGGNGGPDLTRIPTAKQFAAVVRQVTNGGGGMPAFKGQLSDKEIRDVAAWVSSVLNKKR